MLLKGFTNVFVEYEAVLKPCQDNSMLVNNFIFNLGNYFNFLGYFLAFYFFFYKKNKKSANTTVHFR